MCVFKSYKRIVDKAGLASGKFSDAIVVGNECHSVLTPLQE